MVPAFAVGAVPSNQLPVKSPDTPEPGSTVEFGDVLLMGDGADVKLGTPLLKGSKVTATVVRHGKGEKVSIVKFRRRKHYLRRKNHRQPFTEVKITDFTAG